MTVPANETTLPADEMAVSRDQPIDRSVQLIVELDQGGHTGRLSDLTGTSKSSPLTRMTSDLFRAGDVATPDPVSIQLVVSATLAGLGVIALAIAVVCERAVQRHRQPGVTYRQVTMRRDGGWRRNDLFTDTGLRYQRRASSFGVTGAVLLLASLIAYVLLTGR